MSFTRVGLTVVAVIASVVAVYAFFRALDERSAPPIVIEDASATFPVIVDVKGAVSNPGVFELPPGARLQDAVNAAGGLSQEADHSTINLARRLRDGEVVVIPKEAPISGSPSATGAEFDGNGSGSARININTASVTELDVLPGIGEVTAQRIVDFREQNGPYRAIDDLVHVQGISPRTIDELRELVTVGP